jgi:hypothetical protein
MSEGFCISYEWNHHGWNGLEHFNVGYVLCQFGVFRFFALLQTECSGNLDSLDSLLFGARFCWDIAVQKWNWSMETPKIKILSAI